MATPYFGMSARAQALSGRSSTVFLFMAALILAVLAQVAPANASAVAQSVTIDVLPPISQPGAATASVTQARTVIVAQVRPKAAGRPTVLERRQDGSWRAVSSARTNGAGKVTFTAPSRFHNGAAVYRVRAKAFDGLKPVHSTSAKTSVWGQPAFVDEFSGQALGASWSHRGQAYNPWGGRAASKGDPAAVAVGGGALRLSVLADPARTGEQFVTTDADGNPTGSFDYRLNGHVSTQSSFSFTYGVAAARMKFQKARGQHPSFWMQPVAGMSTGAEVDIVEWFGADDVRQSLAANVYPHPEYEETSSWFGGPISRPTRFLDSASDSWWSAYHVFSMEWTPTEYVFRIDGREAMRTTHGVSHDPEYLILSMLSSDWELHLLGDEELLPQHAYVDWVQVWPGVR